MLLCYYASEPEIAPVDVKVMNNESTLEKGEKAIILRLMGLGLLLITWLKSS